MKGVVFKQFESFVGEQFGDAAFERILDATTLHSGPPFVGPGTYPDAELMSLVGTALEQLGAPLDDVLVAFGAHLFHGLAASAPELAPKSIGLFGLLERIDRVIHVEVEKLWPGSVTPKFTPEVRDDGVLEMTYESSRQLCPLVIGLLHGASDYFGEPVTVTHTTCVSRGDDACMFEVARDEGTSHDS